MTYDWQSIVNCWTLFMWASFWYDSFAITRKYAYFVEVCVLLASTWTLIGNIVSRDTNCLQKDRVLVTPNCFNCLGYAREVLPLPEKKNGCCPCHAREGLPLLAATSIQIHIRFGGVAWGTVRRLSSSIVYSTTKIALLVTFRVPLEWSNSGCLFYCPSVAARRRMSLLEYVHNYTNRLSQRKHWAYFIVVYNFKHSPTNA